MSRTLAIGDIHGCDSALERLLEDIAPTMDDTLVILGDYVDRGPSVKAVVERLIDLESRCRLIVLQGNHEEMFRGALSGRGLMRLWLDMGGRATVESYGSLESVPSPHLRFLVSSRTFFETDTEIFVHANLESQLSLLNQTADYLRWKHLGGSERPHISGKRVICGHTSQTDGVPLVFEGWVCLDTAAADGGWLSCLNVETNVVYQARQSGERRRFELAKYA